jgi:septum site-determining protein MinC
MISEHQRTAPVTIPTRPPRHAFRFRGRNFLALVLKPEKPLADWLADLDQWLERSPGFFSGKPLILDLAGLAFARTDITEVLTELGKRAIRILGIEGADPAALDDSLPPLLTGGRTSGSVEAIDAITRPSPPAAEAAPPSPAAKSGPRVKPAPPSAPAQPEAAPPPPPSAPSLLVEAPVRSGQTIMNPDGDVIILGSVASGAEVIAAGSIHVYGALRGRALAGAYGDERARIFCRQFEAELIAIGGYYKVTEDTESGLRHKPVQAWLSGTELMMASLDQAEKEMGTWRKC